MGSHSKNSPLNDSREPSISTSCSTKLSSRPFRPAIQSRLISSDPEIPRDEILLSSPTKAVG